MIGLVFLRPHISQQRPHDRRLRRHDRGGSDIAAGAAARAGNRGADAGHQSDDRCRLRRRKLLAQTLQMTAREMPGFVREHADDFVRGLGIEQRTGVYEDVAAVHDKGVERAIAENDDAHVLLG